MPNSHLAVNVSVAGLTTLQLPFGTRHLIECYTVNSVGLSIEAQSQYVVTGDALPTPAIVSLWPQPGAVGVQFACESTTALPATLCHVRVSGGAGGPVVVDVSGRWHAVVTGLQSGVEYAVDVQCQNEVGWTAWSAPRTFTSSTPSWLLLARSEPN